MAQTQKSLPDTLNELWELLKAYARQETVGPLRHLGRQIGFGIVGSLLFSLGWFLVALSLVRFLQTHTLPGVGDWFGRHDWSPYLLASVLLGAALVRAMMKIRQPDAVVATVATPSARSHERTP